MSEPASSTRPPWLPTNRWLRAGLVLLLGFVALNVANIAYNGFAYFVLPGEESDPGTQSLEVVVDSLDDKGCSLNVPEVAEGTHNVIVVANRSASAVRFVAESGRVIYRGTAEAPAREGEAGAGGEAEVRLRPGTYRVECRSESGSSTTELRVVPAEEAP